MEMRMAPEQTPDKMQARGCLFSRTQTLSPPMKYCFPHTPSLRIFQMGQVCSTSTFWTNNPVLVPTDVPQA